jgi:predicted O-methyltransferase YrrM
MLLTKHKRLRQLCGFAETFSWLTIKLAVKRAGALRLLPGTMFRQYVSLAGDEQWRSKKIFDIFAIPEGTRVTLEHLHGEGINTAIDELAYMAIVTKVTQPKNIFEIGTFRGRTALNFALNSPDDCTVWTLDLPPADHGRVDDRFNAADATLVARSEPGIDYRGKDVAKKIRQLYGNSQQFDFSPYYGRMDIVFVDGAHHYEAVVQDTENALRMVRPGGVILWHDFANYGDYNDVTRAILRLLPADKIIQIAATELAVYRAEESK